MSNKKDKERVRIAQQFMYLLMNIVELYPQYTLTQHMGHILRKKGAPEESYYWSEEFFLKRVEDYYDELNSELVTEPTEDE